MPYTCVLEDCPQPQTLYRTRQEWMEHMGEAHETTKYWLCSACLEPTNFDEKDQFIAHLSRQHGDDIAIEQIPAFVSMSTCTGALRLTRCPLCPRNSMTAHQEMDPAQLLSHVAEHVHSFSLNSLPWPFPGEKEREYLGLSEGTGDPTAEYFNVSSGVGSADPVESSESQAGWRDFETDMPEIEFQDHNPEGESCSQICQRISAV